MTAIVNRHLKPFAARLTARLNGHVMRLPIVRQALDNTADEYRAAFHSLETEYTVELAVTSFLAARAGWGDHEVNALRSELSDMSTALDHIGAIDHPAGGGM